MTAAKAGPPRSVCPPAAVRSPEPAGAARGHERARSRSIGLRAQPGPECSARMGESRKPGLMFAGQGRSRRSRNPAAWALLAPAVALGLAATLGACAFMSFMPSGREAASQRVEVPKAPAAPPRAQQAETSRKFEFGRWQLASAGSACRLAADAPAGAAGLSLEGGAAKGAPARVRLRLGAARGVAVRFRPGARYALRLAAGSGGAVPPVTLSARSAQEAEASVPPTLAGGRMLTAIPAARGATVSGPGLALTLALTPSASAAEAFVGCVETAAAIVRPQPPVAMTRLAGGWEVVQRRDACGLHRLDGPIGVSVAGLRGAGLAVTVHGRGAFEGGRRYELRFSGGAGTDWTVRAQAVSADTLVWAVPEDRSGSARVADLLRGGSLAVAGAGTIIGPAQLPPAGAAADRFLRCGEAVFGPLAPRPPPAAATAAPMGRDGSGEAPPAVDAGANGSAGTAAAAHAAGADASATRAGAAPPEQEPGSDGGGGSAAGAGTDAAGSTPARTAVSAAIAGPTAAVVSP